VSPQILVKQIGRTICRIDTAVTTAALLSNSNRGRVAAVELETSAASGKRWCRMGSPEPAVRWVGGVHLSVSMA
jgi:hypothetical protein